MNPGAKVELMSVETEIYAHYHRLHEEDPSYRPNPDEGMLGSLWKLFDGLMQEVEDA